MLAEKVIAALLVAGIGEDAVYGGTIPQGSPLPAASYRHISTQTRKNVGMDGAFALATTRIQITVKAESYTDQKTMIQSVKAACKNRTGVIDGVDVKSVLLELEGPDMSDDDASIYEQTIDFKVTYSEPN